MEMKPINSAATFQNAIDITNEVGKCINEPRAFAKFKRQIDNFKTDANGKGELAETYLFRAITFYHEWATAAYHQYAFEKQQISDDNPTNNEDFSQSCCICSFTFPRSYKLDNRMLHFINSGHWDTFARLLEERGLGKSNRMIQAIEAVRKINSSRFYGKIKRAKKATKAEKEVMAAAKLRPNSLPKWLADTVCVKTPQEKSFQSFERKGSQNSCKDREKLQAKAQNNDKKYGDNRTNIKKKFPREVNDGTKAWRSKSSVKGSRILSSTRTRWRPDRVYDSNRNHMEINDPETPNDEFDLAQIS